MLREAYSTQRLSIRPIKVNDYSAWQTSSETRLPTQNQWDLGPTGVKSYTSSAFKKLIQKQEQLAKQDKVYIYGIFDRKTGDLLGGVDFIIFYRGDWQMANLGFHLHNRFWGMGYGKEAARAGLVIGFRQLKLNRLEAAIDPTNRRSIGVVKSIGMRAEGIKRLYIFKKTRWVDQTVFAANPDDLGLKTNKPKL